MYRLFVGLDLPSWLRSEINLFCYGVPHARWTSKENLHLSLRFIGEVDGHTMQEVHDSLSELDFPGFSLELQGIGTFPIRGTPRVLWLGIRDPKPLQALKKKVDRRLDLCGIDQDHRKYAPHVTLARLSPELSSHLGEHLMNHGTYRSKPFNCSNFHLYESHLGRKAPVYNILESYSLA